MSTIFYEKFLDNRGLLWKSEPMTEPTAPEIKTLDPQELIAAAALLRACDQSLFDLLSEDVAALLKGLPDKLEMAGIAVKTAAIELRKRDLQIQETSLAISEYANQTGQGAMMMQNLALCLQQIRQRADQRAKLGNQGWG